MKFGIDRLLSERELRAPLLGRRVALLAHPASVTADLTHSLDALEHVIRACNPQALEDLIRGAADGRSNWQIGSTRGTPGK
jgi:uncharacterized protein YbbC (DUF1343 family)